MWDKELVKEQKKLIKELVKIFRKLYDEYAEELKNDSVLVGNDKEELKKMSFDIFSEMLKVI